MDPHLLHQTSFEIQLRALEQDIKTLLKSELANLANQHAISTQQLLKHNAALHDERGRELALKFEARLSGEIAKMMERMVWVNRMLFEAVKVEGEGVERGGERVEEIMEMVGGLVGRVGVLEERMKEREREVGEVQVQWEKDGDADVGSACGDGGGREEIVGSTATRTNADDNGDGEGTPVIEHHQDSDVTSVSDTSLDGYESLRFTSDRCFSGSSQWSLVK